MLIIGFATWNSKKFNLCFISSYNESGLFDCCVDYYTYESLNCSKPFSACVYKTTCAVLDVYKYNEQLIIVPCLISSFSNYTLCPSSDVINSYAKPNFNYVSWFTEAQLLLVYGSLILIISWFWTCFNLMCDRNLFYFQTVNRTK